jgi:hypothetical protein
VLEEERLLLMVCSRKGKSGSKTEMSKRSFEVISCRVHGIYSSFISIKSCINSSFLSKNYFRQVDSLCVGDSEVEEFKEQDKGTEAIC